MIDNMSVLHMTHEFNLLNSKQIIGMEETTETGMRSTDLWAKKACPPGN